MGDGSAVCQLSPGENEDRPTQPTTMSANGGGSGAGAGGAGSVRVDSGPGEEGGGGAPRHSSRSGAAPRSLTRSASRKKDVGVVIGVGRPTRRGNGRTTVCRSRSRTRFSLCFRSGEGGGGERTHRCLSSARTAYASLNARNFSLAWGSLFTSGWNCLLNCNVKKYREGGSACSD